MKNQKLKLGLIVLLVTILTLSACTSEKPQKKSGTFDLERIKNLDPVRQNIGTQMGDFHFVDSGKKPWHSDELYSNKIVLITSFTDGCPACIRGINNLNPVYEKHKDNLEIVYMDVNPEDSEELVASLKTKYNSGDWIWAHYQASLLPFYEKYDFFTPDMTLIANKGGEIVFASSFEVSFEDITAELAKLGLT